MLKILLVLLLVLPAAIGQTYFVYRYNRYSPGWRTNKVGQALMVKSVALAILVDSLVFSELVYYTGNETLIAVGQPVEVVAYLLVTAAIFWQLGTLVNTQNRERRADIDDKDIS